MHLQASIAIYDDILAFLQGKNAAAYIQLRTAQRRRFLTSDPKDRAATGTCGI